MTPDALFDALKILGGAAGTTAAALVTYWKVRDKQLAKERGLADNPERCGKHQTAIELLGERLGTLEETNREDHKDLGKNISDLAIEVARLGRVGHP